MLAYIPYMDPMGNFCGGVPNMFFFYTIWSTENGSQPNHLDVTFEFWWKLSWLLVEISRWFFYDVGFVDNYHSVVLGNQNALFILVFGGILPSMLVLNYISFKAFYSCFHSTFHPCSIHVPSQKRKAIQKGSLQQPMDPWIMKWSLWIQSARGPRRQKWTIFSAG